MYFMKRSVWLTLFAIGFIVVSSAFLSPSTAQQRVTSSKRGPDDTKLAETVKLLTDRSRQDLRTKQHPLGGEYIDLAGRFQQVAMLKSDSDGDPLVGCIGSLEEANDFFGRDLETGEIYPFNAREAEYLATKKAASTDMSANSSSSIRA